MKTQLILHCIEVGCDEAGRGCLAGPVFAAAVILPTNLLIPESIKDSKLLDDRTKLEMREWIFQNAIDFSISRVEAYEIDKINILNASILAMHKAIEQLTTEFDHIVVDGNRFHPVFGKQHTCVVKGDSKLKNIAAASILAKTERDMYMQMLDLKYPFYNWKSNKGYPTPDHKKSIAENGYTQFHRLSFKGVKEYQPLLEQLDQLE